MASGPSALGTVLLDDVSFDFVLKVVFCYFSQDDLLDS